MRPSLAKISKILLSDNVNSDVLAKSIADYKNGILNATALDLSENDHQTHLQLENGIAIGLHWAATCLDDSIRTQKLIRGTKLAIDQKLKDGKEPVHLLYAGTGPFATLILPLLSHFSSSELQVTLLEINPASAENVRKLIAHFGFEEHVNEIQCGDATEVILQPLGAAARLNSKKSKEFDILLSETMQHALQAELQVPITAHLLNQMSAEAILIPQIIELELVAITAFGAENESTQVLGELMKVDADFLRMQYPINSNWTFEKRIRLPESIRKNDGMLAISTSIHVFGNEKIEWNESGLTVPKILAPMLDVRDQDSINLRYSLDPEPGFQIIEEDEVNRLQ